MSISCALLSQLILKMMSSYSTIWKNVLRPQIKFPTKKNHIFQSDPTSSHLQWSYRLCNMIMHYCCLCCSHKDSALDQWLILLTSFQVDNAEQTTATNSNTLTWKLSQQNLTLTSKDHSHSFLWELTVTELMENR